VLRFILVVCPQSFPEVSMSDCKVARVIVVRFAAALLSVCMAQAALADDPALPNNDGADGVLRVCADPNNMPLSNNKGEGFENKIAAQMASDFGYKIEYTYFPQRMGFIRRTLRDKVPDSDRYKCDLVIGLPKGYDLAATTRPYLHSTYAMVFPNRPARHLLADARRRLAARQQPDRAGRVVSGANRRPAGVPRRDDRA
jgi:hypothetical protein